MPTLLYKNFLNSELLSSCLPGSTELLIEQAVATKAPRPAEGEAFALVLANGSQEPEIVFCSSNPGTGLLIVSRGEESTQAKEWPAGTRVVMAVTSALLSQVTEQARLKLAEDAAVVLQAAEEHEQAASVSAQTAQSAAASASIDADRSESYAGIAQGAGAIYETTEDGLAATSSGEHFLVLSGSGSNSWAQAYENVGGSAEARGNPYPALSTVTNKTRDYHSVNPMAALEKFMSGYPESFWDYANFAQYVPAEFSVNGGFTLGAGNTLSKYVDSPVGLRVRIVLTIPSGSMPSTVFSLTNSATGFDSDKNVGVWFRTGVAAAAVFRIDYDASTSDWNTVACADTEAESLGKTYAIEFDYQGSNLVLTYYTDATFEQVDTSFTKALDIEQYLDFQYFNIYANGAGITLHSVEFCGNPVRTSAVPVPDLPTSRAVSPAFFNAAQSYLFENYDRRNTSGGVANLISRGTLVSDRAEIIAKIRVNKAAADGVLIGFGNTNATRVLIGYEPAASYNSMVAFSNGSFDVLIPSGDVSQDDEFWVSARRIGDEYRLRVYGDSALTQILAERKFTDPALASNKYRINLKPATLYKSLQWVVIDDNPQESAGLAESYIVNDGRQVLVTRFGGLGNDWCFVRTPDNYSNTGTAHRLVILNHGNGWTMDGSLAKANFSSKTQFGVDGQNGGTYLDTGRADYVEYSNPLIEALLAEGYVVAGAQNYADGLYGNNDCRTACADFVDWCYRELNVRERVYMVGASNGAMTTLNACRVLGHRVAAIACIYPLCDLIDHYLAYSSHRSAIESAYGLTGSYPDKASLLAEPKLYTHCPVNHDVIEANDGATRKSFLIPPLMLVASGGDTVVSIEANAEPLDAVCQRSRLVSNLIDIDPGGVNGYDHGDWRHFRESAIVNFFNEN